MAKGVFVTGTDTGVGKTVASAALIRFLVAEGHTAVGLKPIASGFEWRDGVSHNEDVAALTAASNVQLPTHRINRYGFTPAIAPHIAAHQENTEIDLLQIKEDLGFAMQRADRVVVEGVGGWLVPINQHGQTIQTLAVTLGLPVVLVVGLRLGCLNHALLTIEAMQRAGVAIAGWVANHVDAGFSHCDENLATLKALIAAPLLFELPYASMDVGQVRASNVHSSLFLA